MVARRSNVRVTATAATTAQLLSVAALLLLLSSPAASQAAAAADGADNAAAAAAAVAPTNSTLDQRANQARTAALGAPGRVYYRNGTTGAGAGALRRAALLGLGLRPASPMDGAREATAMGVYGAAPVKLQYPGEPSFNGITGPLGSIDYDSGDGGECFRYLPGCLACDKFFTVAPGVGALFQHRCLACLQPEYVLNGIKCECGPGFGVPATLGLSAGPKPGRGARRGYGGQATMFTSCQRCPAAFFLDPAFSSDGATLGPACIKCPRNTKANPDQSGCGKFFFWMVAAVAFFGCVVGRRSRISLSSLHFAPHPRPACLNPPSQTTKTECSAGAAPVKQVNVQGETPLTLEPPRCVMCPAGTYVPSPNRGNLGCVPCVEGTTTPPGRFGMISTRFNGDGKDVCNCESCLFSGRLIFFTFEFSSSLARSRRFPPLLLAKTKTEIKTKTGCLPGFAGNPEKYTVPSNGVVIELPGVICVRCLDEGLDLPALKGDVICEEPAEVADDDEAAAADTP